MDLRVWKLMGLHDIWTSSLLVGFLTKFYFKVVFGFSHAHQIHSFKNVLRRVWDFTRAVFKARWSNYHLCLVRGYRTVIIGFIFGGGESWSTQRIFAKGFWRYWSSIVIEIFLAGSLLLKIVIVWQHYLYYYNKQS